MVPGRNCGEPTTASWAVNAHIGSEGWPEWAALTDSDSVSACIKIKIK